MSQRILRKILDFAFEPAAGPTRRWSHDRNLNGRSRLIKGISIEHHGGNTAIVVQKWLACHVQSQAPSLFGLCSGHPLLLFKALHYLGQVIH